MGEDGARDTSEYEARQNRDGKGILLDLLVPGIVGQAEDNVLDLVVDPLAYPKGIGLRVRGKVVQVGLE